MTNFKDKVTNYCALLIAIGTALAGLNVTVLHLPTWITVVGGIMIGLGTTITSVLTGKSADGTKKETP